MLRNGLAIILVAVSLQACFKGDASVGTCKANTDCATGSTCNLSLHVCASSCPELCLANQQCLNGTCVALECLPACDTNHSCDKNQTPPKCIELTEGTASLVKPHQGDIVGGTQISFEAIAGAPGGGPSKVVFRIEQGGTSRATLEVVTGTAGDYSGVLTVGAHVLASGPAKVFASTYYTVNGTAKNIDSPALDVTVDEDAPVINTPTTDHLFYSSTAVTPAPVAKVTVQIADVGLAGVDKSTAQLKLGTHSYPALAPAAADGRGTYSFAVPTDDVGIAANNQATVGYVVVASDKVGNAASFDGGSLAIDNNPPTFPNVVLDPAKFYGGDAGIPIAVDVLDPPGGSGLDSTSVAILLADGTTKILPTTTTDPTRTFLPLGSDLQVDQQQGPVTFHFIARDIAGNLGTSDPQTVQIDRKPPAVGTAMVTDYLAADNGYYPRGAAFKIPVSVTVDDIGGSGVKAVALNVAGTKVADGAFDSGIGSPTAGKWLFMVPTLLAATAGTEGAIPFTLTVTDNAGNTASDVVPVNNPVLKIDNAGPTATTIAYVTGPQFTDGMGLKWYKQSLAGDIEVTAVVSDAGSGVNRLSLALVLTSDITKKVSTGSATGPDNAGTGTFHFFIPRSSTNGIANLAQGNLQFQVAGADNLGNPMRSSTTGTIGIDGQSPTAPTLTFTATYPAADCGAGALCGHDSAHFLRLGDDNKSVPFSANDGTGGSGMNTSAGATCMFSTPTGELPVQSQPACTVTYPGGSGTGSVTYHFTLNPSTLGLNTGTNGEGIVTAKVTAQDFVGNASAETSTNLLITRVKWVRLFGTTVTSLSGPPILTPTIGTAQQLLVAGTGNANDSIYSLGTDGSQIGKAGKGATPPISAVSTSMAFSANTNKLYVLTNTSSVYVFPVTAAGPATSVTACNLGISGSTAGGPAILGSTTANEVAMVSDPGNNRVQVISGNAGACTGVTSTVIAGASNILGAPTTDGAPGASSKIYVPSGGTDITNLTWDGGTLALSTHNSISFNVTTPVAIANALFFGDDKQAYHAFTTAFVSSWTTPALATQVVTTPVVNDALMYGSAGAVDGHLRAFETVGGTQAFQYPSSDTTKIGLISPVVIGGSNTDYFTDSTNHELVALQYIKGKPATTSVLWTYKGQNNFRGANDVGFVGGGPEPTIGPDGTLYFVDGSKVYAIQTDTGASVVPTSGSNWPRVAFDNCNSSNSSYTNCQ